MGENPAVEFGDLLGETVDEETVVRDQHNAAGKGEEIAFQPLE